MHVLVTRPRSDAAAMAARLEAAGHTVAIEPLLDVVPTGLGHIEIERVQAIVATSRNALRALAGTPILAELRALPLVAVGSATGEEAHRCGFCPVMAGPAAARDLPDLIRRQFDPTQGALLHLAGETVAFDLTGALKPFGFELRTAIVYRTVAADRLSRGASEQLAAGQIDGVILMSPRTAEIYLQLVVTAGLARILKNIVHFCLSPAVAACFAGLDHVRTEIPLQPNLEEMLALVARVAAQLSPRA